MEIKYKIKEVKPHIFSVVIKDDYDRAMCFCRMQEYYESPNSKFRGKSFNMWDYIKWYSKEYGKGFTYASDWSGFNVPLEVAYNCYDGNYDMYTPYDEVMEKIVFQIYEMNGDNCNGYIIGSENTKGDTFKHEICHGMYHTNDEYKKLVKENIKRLPKTHYTIFKNNLLEMGYTTKVIDDEIQAYLMYGWESEHFGKGVALEVREMYNSFFSDDLEKFISK